MQDMNNKIRGSYKTKAYLERLFWGVIFFFCFKLETFKLNFTFIFYLRGIL